MEAAFPLDISMFLSLLYISEVYLHRWNLLEGYISQDEVDLSGICQVRGIQPSRTSAFQHFFCTTTYYGVFPNAFSSDALLLVNRVLSPTQKLKSWPPTVDVALL